MCRRTHDSDTLRYSAACFTSQSDGLTASEVPESGSELGLFTDEETPRRCSNPSQRGNKPPLPEFDSCYSVRSSAMEARKRTLKVSTRYTHKYCAFRLSGGRTAPRPGRPNRGARSVAQLRSKLVKLKNGAPASPQETVPREKPCPERHLGRPHLDFLAQAW